MVWVFLGSLILALWCAYKMVTASGAGDMAAAQAAMAGLGMIFFGLVALVTLTLAAFS